MIYNSCNNGFEKTFTRRCMEHISGSNNEMTEYMDPNLLPNGLCPSVIQVMLDDVADILPERNCDDLSLLQVANDLCNKEKLRMLTGCEPEAYVVYPVSIQIICRLSAITAIWLLKYVRSTRKKPYKNIVLYSKALGHLQWCLIRMFFLNSSELLPDKKSRIIEKMQWQKYGKKWYDVRNFQVERIQIFLDILHAYSFEYYPPQKD